MCQNRESFTLGKDISKLTVQSSKNYHSSQLVAKLSIYQNAFKNCSVKNLVPQKIHFILFFLKNCSLKLKASYISRGNLQSLIIKYLLHFLLHFLFVQREFFKLSYNYNKTFFSFSNTFSIHNKLFFFIFNVHNYTVAFFSFLERFWYLSWAFCCSLYLFSLFSRFSW